MSTRERWIVYPLLFLTLGIALREKVIPPTHFLASEIAAQQIRCEQLQVGQMLCDRAEVGQVARIRQITCDRLESGQSACRTLLVKGSSGQPVVVAGEDLRNHNGLVEVFSAKGLPLVRIQSTEGGGMVTTLGRLGRAVIMGYVGENFGVFAEWPGLGRAVPLTPTWRFETKSNPPSPKKGQPPASAPTDKPPEKKEVPRADGKK